MEKLVSEKINNFNLSEKFNELKKLSKYNSMTEDELKQLLIEKSLFDSDFEPKEQEPDEKDEQEIDIEEAKEKLELLPEIKEQISNYFKEVDEHKTKIKTDTIDPLVEFYKELAELKIDLSQVDSESILNLDVIKKLHSNFQLKYYEIKYPKIIRLIIDFLGFTNTFVEKIPVLNEWKLKFEDYNFKLLPTPLSTTSLYKNIIIEKNPKNGETNYKSIIFILNNLIENIKALLLVYSVVQSNISYLKEFGIDGFGDHYYHSLISCVGQLVQLKKAFFSLIDLTETKTEKNINFDNILPFYHWIRERWYPSLQEALMNNLSERHPNVDIVHFIGVISKDILSKLPSEATALRDILLTVNETTLNINKQKKMILDNVRYTETSLFTAYLKKFSKKQSIRIQFEADSKQIKIKTIEKVNN